MQAGQRPGIRRDIRPDIRIDKLLWYLRLTKSRARAQAILGQGHVRLNGRHVDRVSACVRAGDVDTVSAGDKVEGGSTRIEFVRTRIKGHKRS